MTPLPISFQFLGAAGTVTGSKYLIKTDGITLLVDCGLFQGLKKLRELNWQDFPVEESSIDFILLTHGHLDHVGYLPRLVKNGFHGKIIATAPTLQVTQIILEDSAKIQEEEAEKANMEKYSRHKPAMPLYDKEDADKVLPYFSPHPLDEWIHLSPQLSARFRYVGHIIGATFIEMKIGDKLFVFSGDIGRENDILMFPPVKPEKADILIVESTYGNKIHPANVEERLIRVIINAASQNGTIIIPGFAVERIQSLMYILWKLKGQHDIPDIPIYMDSPMGANILEVFRNNLEWHKLSAEDCVKMTNDIIMIKTMDETLKLAAKPHPKIIIAGSGMASGGRVLTYFQHYIGNPAATVILVGHQAEGTRGRRLLEGASEIKLYGKWYPVKAQIMAFEGLSAHADQQELMNWMGDIRNKPEKVFIVHGEQEAAQVLKEKIEAQFAWPYQVPRLYDEVTFNAHEEKTN